MGEVALTATQEPVSCGLRGRGRERPTQPSLGLALRLFQEDELWAVWVGAS